MMTGSRLLGVGLLPDKATYSHSERLSSSGGTHAKPNSATAMHSIPWMLT